MILGIFSIRRYRIISYLESGIVPSVAMTMASIGWRVKIAVSLKGGIMIEEPSWSDDVGELFCDECQQAIIPGKEFVCNCTKYTPSSHEGVYCSDDCMIESHPLE